MGRWMLVTGALGLLAACGYTPGPEVKETRETMVLIVTQINNYKKDVGKWPATLALLVQKPPPSAPEAKKWKGPYLKELPLDAWGKPFLYTVPGKMGLPFDLISWGADGRPGGKKDDQDIAYDEKSLRKKE